jgi:hypothetical protein
MLDCHGSDVFIETMQLGRPRDGDYSWVLREQPRQRDLRRCRFLPLCDAPFHLVVKWSSCEINDEETPQLPSAGDEHSVRIVGNPEIDHKRTSVGRKKRRPMPNAW